ncbi:hypothetical protein IZ6_12010 [Terrihabitans soli]|uniref:Aminoglycoside phosphotransferase domain-containing protein n=1 Tax=Terrihabitans soli TaxID=708113 RepID=A0A6S6QM81_9HYPH|nr:phosphotransferase [Terrihabitans soli]BCJ90466.1 hypothetical protein IZ6_12010 [Terrihabitans soli]
MADPKPDFTLEQLVWKYCSKALKSEISSSQQRFQIHNLTLKDGRRIVAKATPRSEKSLAHLAAAYRIQEGLRGMGVPCARLLAGPELLDDDRIIVVHEHFAPGVPHSCETPEHLAAVASALHTLRQKMNGAPYQGLGQMAVCPTSGMPQRLMELLEKWAFTVNSAEDWAIMHGDFKARNLRFEKARVSAIYDFESLTIGSEAHIVGYSSVVFSGGSERLAINFDLDTARAFIAAYEKARREPFSNVQREAAHGGMIHAMAYMGRLLLLGKALSADELTDQIIAFESKF